LFQIETFTLGPLEENTYLVYFPDEQAAVCIDPGDESAALTEALARRGLTLRHILLTHGHIDHVAGAFALARASGAPVAMHPDDRFMLEELPALGQLFGYGPLSVPTIDADLQGGERIAVGGTAIDILHTPGHSPGSVTFALPGHLFVGDLIFSGNIGRTDLPGGDEATLLRSVREKIWPYPDNTLIHPGHGQPTTVGVEKRMNPFLAEAWKP
jgi:hydroxyacylglutathione hydrolase